MKYYLQKKINFDLKYLLDVLILISPIFYILGSPFVNFLTLLCSIFFIILAKRENKFLVFKEKFILIILTFYFYILINSFFATNFLSSLKTSFFFIRFILFFGCIYFFAFQRITLEKVFIFWILIIFLTKVDILIQFFFGKDIFGYPDHGDRFAGFFGDELIAGSYLQKFCIILMSYFLYNFFKNKKKIFQLILFIISSTIIILITGERMAFLLFCFSLILTLIFLKKYKILILTLFLSLIILINFNSSHVQNRYGDFKNIILNFEDSTYGKLYSSGYRLWKKNPLNGVGVKNFRVDCDIELNDLRPENGHQLCSTHPHNLYLELMSETGLLGLFLFIAFNLIIVLKSFKFLFTKNQIDKIEFYLFICSFSLYLAYIWPLSSNGSFFTTWNGSQYWLVLGLMFNSLNKLGNYKTLK